MIYQILFRNLWIGNKYKLRLDKIIMSMYDSGVDTQIWFGWGYVAQGAKPLPIFIGHFGRKIPPFFRDFAFKNPFRKHQNLTSDRKTDLC